AIAGWRSDASALFRASFRKSRGRSVAGSTTALLAALIALYLLHQAEPLPLYQHATTAITLANVATMSHAADVQWLDKTNDVFVGDSLGTERLRIAAGALQIDFKRGARLVLEGPADLELISDNEAF